MSYDAEKANRETWEAWEANAAYWDGKIMGTDLEAPSGVYVYQLLVDNFKPESMRMTIIK